MITFKYKETIRNKLEQISNNNLNYYANFKFSNNVVWKFNEFMGDYKSINNISNIRGYQELTKDNFYFEPLTVTLPNEIYGTMHFTDDYNASTGIYTINRSSIFGDGLVTFTGNIHISNNFLTLLDTKEGGYTIEFDCTGIENYQYLTENNFLIDLVQIMIPESSIGTMIYTKEYNSNTGILSIYRQRIDGTGLILSTFNVYYLLY